MPGSHRPGRRVLSVQGFAMHRPRRCRPFLSALLLCASLASGGCGSDTAPPTTPRGPEDDTTKVVTVADPTTARTVGFFLEQWAPKPFVVPEFTESSAPAASTATVTVDASSVLTRIPSAIFGHNANSWMTRMVDQPVFLSHTTNLRPNVIRFPGGSLSDVYFWNAQPSAPPPDAPDALLNHDGTSFTN